MITAYVKGQDLQIAQPLTVADTIDYLEMRFCFQTADWDGADKWAHFRQRENIYDINLVDDKITADKHLNLSEGKWEVYLHGTKGNARITTDIEFINVIGTGTLNGKPLPDIPLSAAEQINAKADNAVSIAQSVKADADAGEFNGGYYAPHKRLNKIHWTPSKPDMPEVPEMEIPGGGGGEGGGGASFEIGHGLKIDDNNVLSVDTAPNVEENNTLPITSAAVYTEVGNINALLETI